jgi:NADPH:quinone reductase-like Zn-dependent oxidoreductase
VRAAQFDQYGGPHVLEVREVDDPVLGEKQAIVAVRATGITPGGIAICEGQLHEMWPATFPLGQVGDAYEELARCHTRGRSSSSPDLGRLSPRRA